LASQFIGVGTTKCVELGCKQFYLALVDSLTGVAKNISALPDVFGERADLIHAEADPTANLYYLVYAPTKLTYAVHTVEDDRPVIVTFNVQTSKFDVTYVDDKIKGLYSTCYWPGNVLYGLGWMSDDTPYTLSAFTITKNDYTVELLVELPGSIVMMPDCSYNPTTGKLYFYSRNVGDLPHTLNIWEVDVMNFALSKTWAVNGSHWSQPYLFQYDVVDGHMYALVADGDYNTWLVLFDPTRVTEPFTKILQLPDLLLESNAISYDEHNQEFVYLSSKGEIVSASKYGIDRKPITGILDHTLKLISYLNSGKP